MALAAARPDYWGIDRQVEPTAKDVAHRFPSRKIVLTEDRFDPAEMRALLRVAELDLTRTKASLVIPSTSRAAKSE